MSTIQPEQLVLDVQLNAHSSLNNFVAAPQNTALLRVFEQLFDPQHAAQSVAVKARHIYLHGPTNTGKSHLLQGMLNFAHSKGRSHIYLPLGELIEQSSVALLEGLENYQLVCIDDLQALSGQLAWQEALFHLYNRLQTQSQHILFAARDVPEAIGLELNDLISRLKWGLTYRVNALGDRELRELLQVHTAERGISLDAEVVDYIMLRAERSAAALVSLIEQLDHASWQTQRAITKPFVKQVLGW